MTRGRSTLEGSSLILSTCRDRVMFNVKEINYKDFFTSVEFF